MPLTPSPSCSFSYFKKVVFYRKLRISLPLISLLLIPFLYASTHASEWKGQLRIAPPEGMFKAGQSLPITLQSGKIDKKTSEFKPFAGMTERRQAKFYIEPVRFNLFHENPIELKTSPAAPGIHSIVLPAPLPAGWYEITAIIADDHGEIKSLSETISEKNRLPYLGQTFIAVAASSPADTVRISTERQRCVFSPGEELRFFVSSRSYRGKVSLAIRHHTNPMQLSKIADFEFSEGGPNTIALDLLAGESSKIMPGMLDLVALADGKEIDRFTVKFVSPHQRSGGGRWAHNQYPSGIDSQPSRVTPTRKLHQNTTQGVIKNIHHANFWVNFFANATPGVLTPEALPSADHPSMPLPEPFRRPTQTDAFYQSLMSEGVALGITLGYGEDYRAEVYMPLPTIFENQMAVLSRKYLNGSLSAAHFPNFVSVYTDYYGHMDFTGAGEIDQKTLDAIREEIWKQATAAAGMNGAEKPLRFPFESKTKDLPDDLKNLLSSNEAKKIWADKLKEFQSRHDNDKNWQNSLPLEAKLKLCKEIWTAAGINPVPAPPRYIPLPELDGENTKKFGDQAAYLYASFVLEGIERYYGHLTRTVEDELPAVFSIHNRLGMNHAKVSHAWTGIRTPNVDPAYSTGASAISVSEWNLDGVPKPYFLPTFYNRTLIDKGMPVYRCGLWKMMGSPSRFMRDAVFWGGRQIQTYFDQTRNMTWSHKGSDQTTYASNDRLSAVTEFLSVYSDLFNQLEPVREVGYYIPPHGTPWGDTITRGHYIAMITALMANHQIHMVSHGDISSGELHRYPIIYAPSNKKEWFPFEKEAFKKYIAQGGKIVGAPYPKGWTPKEVYQEFGITEENVPDLDDQGNPRKNKDGSTKTKTSWSGSLDVWGNLTRKMVWGDFPDGITIAPIDLYETYTHLENGKPANRTGSHWTGHHVWATYRGPSLAQAPVLDKTFSSLLEPAVIKDVPEVFVNLNKPKDPDTKGMFLFVSNFKLPEQKDLHRFRVPSAFFNSSADPVVCNISIKSEGIGAIYDIIESRKIEPIKKDGRLAFPAHLDSVEGRIFALYPEEILSAKLTYPEKIVPGKLLSAHFHLEGSSSKPLPVLASVRIQLSDSHGNTIYDLHRALPADGALPPLPVPAIATPSLQLTVTDTITGFSATAQLNISASTTSATPAPTVTIHRGDRIHAWLNQNKTRLKIMTDSGDLSWNSGKKDDPLDVEKIKRMKSEWSDKEKARKNEFDRQQKQAEEKAKAEGKSFKKQTFKPAKEPQWPKPQKIDFAEMLLQSPNPHLAKQHAFAQKLAEALAAAGFNATIAESETILTRPLFAHPWEGPMSPYRTRHTVPDKRTDEPVLIVGSPADNRYLDLLERSGVAPRSFSHENTSGGRAVVAWLPKCFSPQENAVALVASDETGVSNAITALLGLAKTPAKDLHYLARESTRMEWAPSEVELHKSKKLKSMPSTPKEIIAGQSSVAGERSWKGLRNLLGTPIFAIDASAGGVAVGTKSWVKPLGLLSPEGEVRGFYGGGLEVTPRDVAVSNDGKTVAGGFSLFGKTAAYRDGKPLFSHRSGIAYKDDNPYLWDSFKDTDRHLAVSPDHRTIIASAGPNGILAYNADSGNELWKITNAPASDKPLGSPLPEIAFSPDSSRVLLFRVLDEGLKDVEFEVMEPEKDEAGNYKRKSKETPKPVKIKARGHRSQLMLLDTVTGKPVWSKTTAYRLYDINATRTVWESGTPPVLPVETSPGKWTDLPASVSFPEPIDSSTGKPIPWDGLKIPFWHLYSTVGPAGKWTILGTRETRFMLLDENGNLMREFDSSQLPIELDVGDMIPPHIITSNDPERILIFSPQGKSLFVFKIKFGTPEQIETARLAENINQASEKIVREEFSNSKNFKKWGDQNYVQDFFSKLVAPSGTFDWMRKEMAAIAQHIRAKRTRDWRHAGPLFERFKNELYQEDKAILDAALSFSQESRIDVPAIISDAEASPDLSTIYVSLWDGTIGAYDPKTGAATWKTPVVGGGQLAAVQGTSHAIETLYLGGSRGDLYKISPADGKIIWHKNITADSNSF